MKTIEVDEELYRYIASQTQHIGESASDILRRLLLGQNTEFKTATTLASLSKPKGVNASKGINTAPVTYAALATDMLSLLKSDVFRAQGKVINRFMLILSTLYQLDSQAFSEAAALKGRTRVYFADNAETLLKNGKTTKPKHIPETPYWVITNTNTGRKRQMVEQLMEKMDFPVDVVEKVVLAI